MKMYAGMKQDGGGSLWNHHHQPASGGIKVKMGIKIFWFLSVWAFHCNLVSRNTPEELLFFTSHI
jgi:hypothetical protein